MPKNKKPTQRLRRLCTKCEGYFTPTGKFNYVCENCCSRGSYWRMKTGRINLLSESKTKKRYI
jgi:hypothetical protein